MKLWTHKEVFKEADGTPTVFRHLQWPLSEGGRLWIDNLFEDEEYKGWLDLESVEKGLKLMAEKSPKHFSDFLTENEDGYTGDVFLQYCIFGKLIYG